MQTFVFAADPLNLEIEVQAEDYASAHKKAWGSLTPEQQDNLECLDFIDNYFITPEGEVK